MNARSPSRHVVVVVVVVVIVVGFGAALAA